MRPNRIIDVIDKPPDELTVQDIDDALDAVFQSHESIGDFRGRMNM
jgi:hypothetical protein